MRQFFSPGERAILEGAETVEERETILAVMQELDARLIDEPAAVDEQGALFGDVAA